MLFGCCAHQAYAYHLYAQLPNCSLYTVMLHDVPPDSVVSDCQPRPCCSITSNAAQLIFGQPAPVMYSPLQNIFLTLELPKMLC